MQTSPVQESPACGLAASRPTLSQVASSSGPCPWFTLSLIHISSLVKFSNPKALIWRRTSILGGISSRLLCWPGLERGGFLLRLSRVEAEAKLTWRGHCTPLYPPQFSFCLDTNGKVSPLRLHLPSGCLCRPCFPKRYGFSVGCCFCDWENSLAPWNQRLPPSSCLNVCPSLKRWLSVV